ncbi:Alpha/Beta hydrolase protein [Trichoderma sp. SZMC 28014]
MAPITSSRLIKVSEDVTIELSLTIPADNTDQNIPSLIFLHFWGGSSRTFKSVIDILSPSYPTIGISLRGWGASTAPDVATAYKVTDFASDVESVIEQMDLKSVVLVGHSMGGKVSMAIAGRRLLPEGVLKGMALVGPAPPGPVYLPDPNMKDAQIHAFDNMENAENVIRTVLSAPGNLTDGVVKVVAEDMVRGNKWAKYAWPAYGMEEDMTDLFERINVPVVVLAGEKDILEPVERMRTDIRDKIHAMQDGKASLVVVDGAGHLMPLEKPKEVAYAINCFIQAL